MGKSRSGQMQPARRCTRLTAGVRDAACRYQQHGSGERVDRRFLHVGVVNARQLVGQRGRDQRDRSSSGDAHPPAGSVRLAHPPAGGPRLACATRGHAGLALRPRRGPFSPTELTRFDAADDVYIQARCCVHAISTTCQPSPCCGRCWWCAGRAADDAIEGCAWLLVWSGERPSRVVVSLTNLT
jgi:hypothetical protein